MKKNFLAGLVTGICGALLLFAICGAVLLYVGGRADDGTSSSAKSIASKQSTTDVKEEVPYNDIVKKLEYLQKLVDNYYLEDVKNVSFADGIYKGFIKSLDDPYSTYYTKEEYSALMESSSGVYCGIGATVSQDTKTGVITIVKPFKGSPAYKAGILPGDVIYKVNGEDVTGVDLAKVVSNMKGVEGSTVDITIVRKGKADPMNFTIERQKIEVPTIEYQMLDNKIGYIIISEFDEVTVDQFIAAVDELEADGMKGLIVDVRNNPGGLLDSVVKILDRLLPPELIVYTEDKNDVREEEKAVDDKKITVPMAVLINGNSASAAEIFAGTLQDYKTATIIGTTSFGKGIVQKVIPLSDGTAVKLTISKYYTPNGRNIHGTGITPDIEVELNEAMQNEVTVPIDKDNQLQDAIQNVLGKMK
ncbi:MAG TPA: S41 family peptidase [Mobilitalea sp.]|nr:S41 family peptidase [Mobilitalea sp.]